MPGREINDFSTPDEVRSPARTTVELVKLADGEIGRYTFQPGWRRSECITPIVGTDSRQVEHVGYVVSGSLRVHHDEGSTGEATAGTVYRIAAGHDAWVLGNEPVVMVESQGAATYARH